MSSVQSFLRQIPTGQLYLTAPADEYLSYAVEFVPTSGNYVGNYPPGYVQSLPAATVTYFRQQIAGSSGPSLLRDMGKTIFAPFGNQSGAPAQYWRQVQLIFPKPINATQGFMGGIGGSTFGVSGAPYTPDAYTNYLTFYVPQTVAGIGGASTFFGGQLALTGGQM